MVIELIDGRSFQTVLRNNSRGKAGRSNAHHITFEKGTGGNPYRWYLKFNARGTVSGETVPMLVGVKEVKAIKGGNHATLNN